LRKLLGYEKELLLAMTQRKQQQKLLGTTISLRWWASVYQLLDRVNFFFHQYSIFISILLSPACFGLLVLQQHFLFWDTYNFSGTSKVTGELQQSWKQRTLPMEFDQLSCDNLEWFLTCLARIEKKFCIPKEL
jgi:hypothetical protein